MITEYNTMSYPTLAEDMVVSLIPEDHLRKDFLTTEELEPGLTATWGIQDGKPVCRITEHDFDDKILACKILRDAEMTYKERMASSVQREYIITKGLRLELYARGHDVDAIVASGDKNAWKPIDYIIETEFPFLKTTNRSLILNKSKKKDKRSK